MITITIAAALKVHNLPGHLVDQFIHANTFENPKYSQLRRMGFWVGSTEPNLWLYQLVEGVLILPRGFLPTALHHIKAANLPFTIDDKTVCPTAEFSPPSGQLYPFQAKALEELLRYRSGIMESPTGSGKTVMLLSAIPRLKTNTLILVHTTELLNQTMNSVRSWLGVEPGIFGSGKEDIRPVTVGMIQTLSRRNLEESEISDYFGAIMIDEAHHCPALTWAKILEQLPARFKYGFTATAWRKDGLQFLMWRLISSRTAKVTRQEAEEAGKIIWPDSEVVHTDYYYPLHDASEWTRMITDLVRDPIRNQLITQEVRKRITVGTQALILTDRIAHANRLSQMLEDFSPVLVTGELFKDERTAAMAQVRAGAQLTIATTHLLGEGIDVPGWDLLFLVCPISGGPRTLQAVGRIARPSPGKTKALLVDFLDSNVPILKAAFRKRQDLYAA